MNQPKMSFRLKFKNPIMISSFSILSACGIKNEVGSENIETTQSGESYESLKVDVNKYASHKLICDPFSDVPLVTVTTYEQGIKANLYYRETGMPRMYKAMDYINFTRKSEKDIFLTDINVPTRMFTEGFSTSDGKVLKKDNEEKLIEYFGLKMSTHLVLAENDEEGFYELAVLADDGSNLIIKSGDGDNADEMLINNDGDHPTRMGCSSRVINLKKNAMLPIEMHYYQGPKYHISNVLIWRKSATAGTDPSCGLLGNSLFFNPNKNSEKQPAYKDLLARGWKVVRPENFKVGKNSIDYNPCVKGTAPIINQFAINAIEGNWIQISFKTDIPSTAQLQFTNTLTGAITTTTSDNLLRTNHILEVNNLLPGGTYKVKAVAVSSDLGRTLSAELELKIP